MVNTSNVPRRVVVLAGASGLVGTRVAERLRADGWEVRRLVRRAPAHPGEHAWDPARGVVAADALAGAAAVVNLAGENIAGGRWTKARRHALRASRLDPTRTLVRAIAGSAAPPAVYVGASAVGFYGARGEEVLDEAAARGAGFLADLTAAWEEAAAPLDRGETRRVALRLGVVLSPAGGALARLLPLFRLGLGGRVGHGRQWMSWIGLEDATAAFLHAINQAACRGPLNAVSPAPVTNGEFTRVLARVLRRPALLPVPASGLRLAFGAMAEETLLASTRAVPRALEQTGFVFHHPGLEDALRHELAGAGGR